MRKIIFCIATFFAQGLVAQTTLIPFTPNIPFSGFTTSLDAYANEIVASAAYGHDFTQSRIVVFEKIGNTISQETYFSPSDMAVNDNFGVSLSIDNDFIAASSKLNDQVASNAGAVYMYRKVAGNWIFFQKLTAFDGVADDYFGSEVKVVGNQLFISSVNNEAVGQTTSTNSGAVYVYKFNGTSWVFSQKLTVNASYMLGIQIRVENNKMVIASNSSFGTSFLHTYNYDGTNWNFSSSMSPVNPTNESIYDFDLNNNQLFILPSASINSIMNIYDAGVDSWNLNTTLTGINLYDKRASNFKIHNDLMLISLNNHALLYTAKTPTAIYRKIAGNWTFQEYVYGQGPSDSDDAFGTKIAITDDIVVLGAPYEYLPTAEGGRAYVVDVTLNVNDNALNAIQLYPNPTTSEVHLSGNLSTNIKCIDIYQFDGKLIKTIENSQNPISLTEFQNGVYLLKFTMDNGSFTTRKIVKN